MLLHFLVQAKLFEFKNQKPRKNKDLKMVQAGGLEPPAYFLGGSRSILMSYACTYITQNICKLHTFFALVNRFARRILKTYPACSSNSLIGL